MKQNLSPEISEKRRKFKIILGILLVLFIIGKCSSNQKNSDLKQEVNNNTISKEELVKRKEMLDNVIVKIKINKDVRIKDIAYLSDSTLKIELGKKQDQITAQYFDIEYNLMSLGNISEIEVYSDNKLQSAFGLHTARKFDRFKREYVAAWDGSCRPVTKYIKSVMNDPASFDHEQTFVTPLLNGNYEVKTIFRGKNGFGAVVLNSSFAEVSPSGNVLSFKIE
ncbi:MAG: hypothetical protein WAO52_06685 [Prolixibacteraceae bacterium]